MGLLILFDDVCSCTKIVNILVLMFVYNSFVDVNLLSVILCPISEHTLIFYHVDTYFDDY